MSAQSNRVALQTGEIVEPGYRLLADLKVFIRRFCAFPDEHCLNAVTLWVAHAHMVEHFHTTPRLAMLSPEPSSGKTRVLEVLDLLVPESMFVFNASPAAIFRSLAVEQRTLLFDECDAIWSKKGRDENHEDLRALLNAGYKKGANIPRCTGKNHEVTHFNAYCAVALAGLGELPDTIMTRSVIIKMRRRAPTEKIEAFRSRRHESEGHEIRDRLQAWSNYEDESNKTIAEQTGDAWPVMPKGVEDRNEEIWEPLIAVADSAGGEWPALARIACVELLKAAGERQVSLGIRLLGDIRKIFLELDVKRMSTNRLIDKLKDFDALLGDDAPWANLYGEGLDPRKLSKLLRPYGISPKKLDIEGTKLNGYSCESLSDAWVRYLAIPDPVKAELPELIEPDLADTAARGQETRQSGIGVPEVPDVPDYRETMEGIRI